ncbi:pyridoxal 5'-phosphate synthase glutaminase subunit PdxT [Candidatus Parcubacteria bacterium]|jgi:pyridoxal 5'-phosphate synthase pdxT subunit|nr:pyridoxal 5'-phosphate synthase glutaminase subunit PdxT [Candidatus Parcubacteria bacterium]MBT3948620.1 pyridoxal 5'-phosphate synthase glutaminase subunit PdxT [Candidatus Parcubacteria bacterium]
MKKIGILAIQGSVIEHEKILKKLNADYYLVRTKEDLSSLTHLIIPGGESTTMEKLLRTYNIWDILQEKINVKSLNVFGTCAGAILLSKLGMDIEIERNGFGSQLHSFYADIESDKFQNLKGVFIRAPKFTSHSNDVIVLATYNDEPVLLEQNNMLACGFHPELNDEVRIHEWFLR